MNRSTYKLLFAAGLLGLTVSSCKVPQLQQQMAHADVPVQYQDVASEDSSQNTGRIGWREFFKDPNLQVLIDTALHNNKELQITLQEIEIARNEASARRGKLLPTVSAQLGAGVEKVGRYTSQGAGDASTEIQPGKEMPDPLGNFEGGLMVNWEVDIWKKLRNAEKAAVARYLSTVEGKNFVLTNLIAEVADNYYELISLDNQLAVVQQNIQLQQNALEIIKAQKDAARATELAVQKFKGELLKSQAMQFNILQNIKEKENSINFLLGRYAQPVVRSHAEILDIIPNQIKTGVPSQLLQNRPDIKQSELQLQAANLDVKVARAEFYPSLDISAALGLEAFKPASLFKIPESVLFNTAGELSAPLLNRSAITAEYKSANARQIQAVYSYEQTILNAFLDVSNGVSKLDNLQKSYEMQIKEVEALTNTVSISSDLFKSARADYLEVLLAQRDALDARLELIENKKAQLSASVELYKELGGGWK